MILSIANEDFQLKCSDSLNAPVDVSSISKDLCMIIQKSASMKVNNKSAIHNIQINVTAATGSITTSLINNTSVKFVSAIGTIQGSSQKNKNDNLPLCLCDPLINNLTAAAYSGIGSIGNLIVSGTNTESGASVIDNCKIWISNAGQDDIKAD